MTELPQACGDLKKLLRSTQFDTGLIMIAGAAHSGKSALLSKLPLVPRPTTLIGTMDKTEATILKRVNELKSVRPLHWATVEEPVALTEVFSKACRQEGKDHVIIDALNHWIAQLLVRDSTSFPIEEIEARLDHEFLLLTEELAKQRQKRLITVVSSEVGASLAPSEPLGRLFRQQLGKYNQQLATTSDLVLLVQFGLAQCIKAPTTA